MAKAKLALLGGKPVCSEPLITPEWPPLLKSTAKQLNKIYFSRKWAFGSPAEEKFAQDFADYHNAKYGIFMANGTVTLQCALAACEIGAGDEVLVPALTWIATAMAVHYVGAKPVFVDIEPDTLCIDPKAIKKAITNKTRAIIPVHLYGSMADMEAVLSIAKKHKLSVIEDCAHMHGGKWKNRGVGSWGDVGSFSFQQTKTLASGEGGICITNDSKLADKIFRMKHIGYPLNAKQGHVSQGPPPGLTCHNFRGTAFQAAILSDQLKGLKRRIERYNKNIFRLQKHLSDAEGVRIQKKGRLANPQGFYAFALIFDQGIIAEVSRDSIVKALLAEGLEVIPSYGSVYNHKLFNLTRRNYKITGGRCPITETTGTQRTVVLLHNWLNADYKRIDTIGKILVKLLENSDALLEFDRSKS